MSRSEDARKLDLLLSQPEVLRWLELTERQARAWLAPAPSASARRLAAGGGLAVIAKPLRDGDVRTVASLFAGLSERSRRLRFNGPKPCLTRSELRSLATVDRRRRALVAHLERDQRPVGIARLVQDGDSAEIAFAVVDEHQRRGIGAALVSELLHDARSAGITEVTALVAARNSAALALLRRVLKPLNVCYEGADLSIRAALV